MTDYLKLDPNVGCTVNDKIFKKFGYASTVSADDVGVIPIEISLAPGLRFLALSGFWEIVGPNKTISAKIDYIVVVPAGKPLITTATLLLLGAAENGGSITDVETIKSLPPPPNSSTLMTLTAFCDGSIIAPCEPDLAGSEVFQVAVFDVPTDVVEVDNRLTIQCGEGAPALCGADVFGVRNRFLEVVPVVPEPTSLLLCTSGLGLLFVLRVVRNRRWRENSPLMNSRTPWRRGDLGFSKPSNRTFNAARERAKHLPQLDRRRGAGTSA